MSVEITLYTKKATKSALIKFLKTEGLQKTRHFLDEMNTSDKIHYMWFSFDDYESSGGVEATIYKSSIEEQTKYKCSEWILHTRTRSSGSHEDKQKQNEIIRKARRLFNGTFYNDWYGTNIYTNLNDYTKFSPLEKGISIIASNSIDKLSKINNCLTGYKNEVSETLTNIHIESLKDLLKNNDPSIVLYNSLMPFLVSVLEYFYGQCFVNFLKYDTDAKKLLVDEKLKLGVQEVIHILQKENTLEQIIAQSYNFQNLDSINKAYKKFLSIDVISILGKKKKINGKTVRVLVKIQEILEARHRFVHELDINYDLTKQIYLDYITIVECAISLTIDALKTKRLKIEINYYN